jgi:Fe-S cluster biogenesis protein NfuA
MLEEVNRVIDQIRPILQADGGNIEVVSVSDDGVVSGKLKGACVHCPSSIMTLKQGVEKILMEQIPQVKEVVSV